MFTYKILVSKNPPPWGIAIAEQCEWGKYLPSSQKFNRDKIKVTVVRDLQRI
jgi:hypothetical protein